MAFVLRSQTEYNGGVAVSIECCDSLSDGLADIVEVGRIASDHATEHYNGIVTR